MFAAYGWMVIQSSRAKYVTPHSAEFCDSLDEEVNSADTLLHRDFSDWIEENLDTWVKWQFSEQINNHSGIFQFHTSRNHGGSSTVWALVKFVADQSNGSYGVVFIQDDEADNHNPSPFSVWRILDGNVTEDTDTLFSTAASPNAFGDLAENIIDDLQP